MFTLKSTIEVVGAVKFCVLADANIIGLSEEISYVFNNTDIGSSESGVLKLNW